MSSCASMNRRCVWSPRLFPGMDDTLQQLEQRGISWGIVTNKFARFTLPLVQALSLSDRAACVVSGDTTKFSKPHPAPLLHALAAAAMDASMLPYTSAMISVTSTQDMQPACVP